MSPFLSERAAHLREAMDDPACDPGKLARMYRQFPLLNHMLSGWRRIYLHYLRPCLGAQHRRARLLDIGCGGGDIVRALCAWAAGDGLNLEVTAIDRDPRAIAFAREMPTTRPITYRVETTRGLRNEGACFDLVISNHVLHHLEGDAFASFLEDADFLAARLIVMNDIERHPLGYLLFPLVAAPFFRSSHIVSDGLISIRRSFTRRELRSVVPPDWTVRRMFPFRLLLLKEKLSEKNVGQPPP